MEVNEAEIEIKAPPFEEQVHWPVQEDDEWRYPGGEFSRITGIVAYKLIPYFHHTHPGYELWIQTLRAVRYVFTDEAGLEKVVESSHLPGFKRIRYRSPKPTIVLVKGRSINKF